MTTPVKFADRLIAAVGAETGGLMKRIHMSLLRHVPDLSIDHHERILKGLQADGIAGESGDVVHAASGGASAADKTAILTPMQASAMAASTDPHGVTYVMRQLARIGYSHPDMSTPIDTVAVTAAMRKVVSI
jgi:hypothetical protein